MMRKIAWERPSDGATICDGCVPMATEGESEWECVNAWDWEPEDLVTCDACGTTVCNTLTEGNAWCDELHADRVAATLTITQRYSVRTVETGIGIYCLRVHRHGLHYGGMRYAYVGPYDADGRSEFGESLITVAPGAADGTLHTDGITVGSLADVVDMVKAILI